MIGNIIIITLSYLFGVYLTYNFYTAFTEFWYGKQVIKHREFKLNRNILCILSFIGLITILFTDIYKSIRGLLKKN